MIDIHTISFETNLKRGEKLIVSIYRPPSLKNPHSCDKISDFYLRKYDKVVLDTFHFEPKALTMMYFMESQYQISWKTIRALKENVFLLIWYKQMANTPLKIPFFLKREYVIAII